MDVRTTLYGTRGAVTAVARHLNITDAAVSQWKTRGIPAKRLPQVEAALREHLERIGGHPIAAGERQAAEAA